MSWQEVDSPRSISIRWTRGDHTLEASIQRFVGGCNAPESPEHRQWLFRKPDGMNMRWTTKAKSGRQRTYVIGANALRCLLLDCILMKLKNGPIISHDDIMAYSNHWKPETYFADKGGAARGPIRGHVNALRRELGMVIDYTIDGISVTQPED